MPSVSSDVLDKYLQAGRIAREARDFGIGHVRAGGSSLELADAIENLIRQRGGQCAFPVNIGVNEVAAHYTPSRANDIRFKQGDLVKIDVGAHVDGYPADTAASVEIGTRRYDALVRSAEEALKMCIEMTGPGMSTSSMGATVSRVVKAAGFKPIQNLTGHSMERWNLHAGLSIPNIETREKDVLEEGMIIAIEPFATVGAGKVSGGGRGDIFRIVRDRKAPDDVARLFSRMKAEFGPFPFAGRWCDGLDHNSVALVGKMVRLGMIMAYPILSDVGEGAVAQSEHSIIVTRDGCRILT